jgi:L-cysteine S-thiosulfotransferase
MRGSRLGWVVLVSGGLLACQADPRSSAGFRLPPGDVERGRVAFVELKCHACHEVSGLDDLPAPVVDPKVPVVLGGEIPHVRTDGDLITSIINPSHKIAPGYPLDEVRRGEESRMIDYSDAMTVRQMIDLVAFLQSRYTVIRPGK